MRLDLYLYENGLSLSRTEAKKIILEGNVSVDGIVILKPSFDVSEKFTGIPGTYVPLSETIRGFREIIEGKHDRLPESAFLFVGTIDEAVAKAEKARV